jgi:hypothetical protein
MLPADRWEQGSEFHWVPLSAAPPPPNQPSLWQTQGQLYGSGRDALRAMLAHGQAARGWRRLWLPSYFCQDVIAALRACSLELCVYDDDPQQFEPRLDQIDPAPGNVLLLVNFFGLRDQSLATQVQQLGIELIEDHTHDPWSAWAAHSTADWAVASLRKTLPVPDGGVLWSPSRHPLPATAPLTTAHAAISLKKLTGMMLKRLYLLGWPIEKAQFREWLVSAEQAMAGGAVSGMPEWTRRQLLALPVAEWQAARRRNHQALAAALADLPWVTVLHPMNHSCTTPFSGILVFDTHQHREQVRQQLINARIYPAILWPLDQPAIAGIPERDQAFAQRMLSIHCDLRYTIDDMKRVAACVRGVGEFARVGSI